MYDVIVLPGCENTLFVFAAGNDGENNDSLPRVSLQLPPSRRLRGGAPNVLCVAATDDVDELTDFSNFGELSVRLAAPGADILSTWPAYQTIFAPDDFDASVESIFRKARAGATDVRQALRSGRTTAQRDSRYAQPDGFSVGNYADDSETLITQAPPVQPRPSGWLSRVLRHPSGHRARVRPVPRPDRGNDRADHGCGRLVGLFRAACSSRCPRIFR